MKRDCTGLGIDYLAILHLTGVLGGNEDNSMDPKGMYRNLSCVFGLGDGVIGTHMEDATGHMI